MRRGDAGFSLIEVIVALAVVASAMAMLYSGLGQSWSAQQSAVRASEALSIGQNVIAGLGANAPLADGQTATGDENGIGWEVRVERYGAGEFGASSAGAPAAYWLNFVARWPDSRRRSPHILQLRALRLGVAQ